MLEIPRPICLQSWCIIFDRSVYFLAWHCWKHPVTFDMAGLALWLGQHHILYRCFGPNKLHAEGSLKNLLIFPNHFRELTSFYKQKPFLRSIITPLIVLEIKASEFCIFLKVRDVTQCRDALFSKEVWSLDDPRQSRSWMVWEVKSNWV